MALPQPGRIPDELTSIEALAIAVRSQQQYMTQLYNATRQTVVAMEAIAQIAPLLNAVSASPTQAEVDAIRQKVNEIIVTANTPINQSR